MKSGRRYACVASLLLSGLVLAPLVMPILPVSGFLRYQRALGGFTPVRFEHLGQNALPQQFSDEFGWDDMARATGKVFSGLSDAEKKETAIFANNYGEAAAIDFFGPRYGLPRAISNNESYWMWGPREYTGSRVIVLGSDGKGDRDHFRTVQPMAEASNPYARNGERFSIYLCRGLSGDLGDLWPKLKKW